MGKMTPSIDSQWSQVTFYSCLRQNSNIQNSSILVPFERMPKKLTLFFQAFEFEAFEFVYIDAQSCEHFCLRSLFHLERFFVVYNSEKVFTTKQYNFPGRESALTVAEAHGGVTERGTAIDVKRS